MKKLSIFMIICLIGFPQISETIYTPSLPDVARQLHISPFLAELTLGIYFIGFSLGVMLWGIIADQMGRRPALLWGLVVYILGCLGCMYSQTIELFFFFRILQAFGASAGSVVTMTVMRDLYSGQERVKIFSTIGAALALSPALGPVIGGYIDQFFSWQANFLVLIFIGIALLIRSFFSLSETKPVDMPKVDFASLYKLLVKMIQDKHIIASALLIGACNGILFSYYAEAPFIFIEYLLLTPGQYGLLGLVVAFATFAASITSRYLVRSYTAEYVIFIGACLSLFGASIATGATLLGWVEPQNASLGVIAITVPLFILFFGVCLIIPNSLSIALRDYGYALGSAGSILGSIYYVMIALMTAAMSFFHNATVLPMPLYFFSLALLLFLVSRETKHFKLAVKIE